LRTRIKATEQSSQDNLSIKPLLATRVRERFAAAAMIDPQRLKYGQRGRVLDHPIGNRRIQVTLAHVGRLLTAIISL
jgi:hypothetical protein